MLNPFTNKNQSTKKKEKCFDFEPFPVTPKNVCRFLVHSLDRVCYTTLNNYVSALNALSKLHTDYVDLHSDYGVILVLRGLKRIKGDASEPMDPLLPTDLCLIQHQVDFNVIEERIVWLIVLIAFRILLRKSHFVCDRDSTHLICTQDVEFFEWGCIISVFNSKTIQFHESSYKIPIHSSKGKLCPVALLREYMQEFPKRPSDFLFSLPVKGSQQPISYNRALT